MNITEQQVREVLERHGMSSWLVAINFESLVIGPSDHRRGEITLQVSGGVTAVNNIESIKRDDRYSYTWKDHIEPALSELLDLISHQKELSQLQEQVKQLKAELNELNQTHINSSSVYEQKIERLEEHCEKWEELWKKADFRADKLEAENASLLEKFGPIDEAESKAAEVEDVFKRLSEKSERLAEILIDLNEAVL